MIKDRVAEQFELGCGIFIIGLTCTDDFLLLIGAHMAGSAMKEMEEQV